MISNGLLLRFAHGLKGAQKITDAGRPSDFVSRSAHLSFDIDQITGPISPIWAGQHDMGFRGDTDG